MQTALLAILGASAVALPTLPSVDEIRAAVAAAPKCTGADDPKHTAPFCYFGKDTILGLKEAVTLKVMHYANGKGQLTLHATGASPEDCAAHNFTKQNQTINVDLSDCISATTKFTAKYCSDQDAVQLSISIAHVPVPDIPVTLTSTTC